MTGQMGRALGKLARSRSEGACVCVVGGGDEFHVCADMSTLGTLSSLPFPIPRDEGVN